MVGVRVPGRREEMSEYGVGEVEVTKDQRLTVPRGQRKAFFGAKPDMEPQTS